MIGKTLARGHRKTLKAAIDWLHDHWIRDIVAMDEGKKAFRETSFTDHLPRVFLHKYDATTARALLGCLTTVEWKLLKSDEKPLGCTGEELVLHAIIDVAKSLFEIQGKPTPKDAFEDFIDEAFEDTDVLLLFDPKLDGIERSEDFPTLGLANLEYKKWFWPFRGKSDDGR